MTYEAFEEGHGYPVELYQFKRGLSESYLQTSHDEDIFYQSDTYLSTQIQRGKIEQNAEIERQNMKIKIQRDNPILDNFIQFPPTEIITVTVLRYHANDGGTPEVATIWQGRVLTADFIGSGADLDCEPVFTSLKRPGLRRKYQTQCPHVLYGPKCQVNNFAFNTFGTLSVINGPEVTAPQWVNLGTNNAYLRGGYIQFDNRDLRTIIDYNRSAGIITMASGLDILELGNSVNAFPGCQHDLGDCKNIFNNIINYGGFPYVPSKNPFGGGRIF